MASPHDTAIGTMFARSWPVRIAAVAVGMSVVARDLYVFGRTPVEELSIAVLGALVLFALARGDRKTLGIAAPAPSTRWWLRTTLVVGSGFVIVVCAIAAMLWVLDVAPPIGRIDDLGAELWAACVRAPVYEELVYRLLLCAPLVAVIGRWPTIVASGIVFAFIHYRAGVLAVDNSIAGLLLGWAYLRSGSLAVPIVLHALGNALVVAFLVRVAPHLAL